MPRPKPAEPNVPSGFRLPRSLRDALDARAQAEGVDRSTIARRLLEQGLKDAVLPPPVTHHCPVCRWVIRTYSRDAYYDHAPGCEHAPTSIPPTKDYMCAAECGHGFSAHQFLGCGVQGCPCEAPHGRILPNPEGAVN